MIAAFSVVPCGTVRIFQAQSSMPQSEQWWPFQTFLPLWVLWSSAIQNADCLSPQNEDQKVGFIFCPKDKIGRLYRLSNIMDVEIKWCCISSIRHSCSLSTHHSWRNNLVSLFCKGKKIMLGWCLFYPACWCWHKMLIFRM